MNTFLKNFLMPRGNPPQAPLEERKFYQSTTGCQVKNKQTNKQTKQNKNKERKNSFMIYRPYVTHQLKMYFYHLMVNFSSIFDPHHGKIYNTVLGKPLNPVTLEHAKGEEQNRGRIWSKHWRVGENV